MDQVGKGTVRLECGHYMKGLNVHEGNSHSGKTGREKGGRRMPKPIDFLPCLLAIFQTCYA